MLTTKFNKI